MAIIIYPKHRFFPPVIHIFSGIVPCFFPLFHIHYYNYKFYNYRIKMKISLISDNLQKKLLFVNHAISTRSQLPVLLNFLLEAKEGKLIISATDLEIGIITEVSAKTEKRGTITVPAKTFVELIEMLPSGKTTLETTGEGLVVSGEKEKNVFQTSPQKTSQNYMKTKASK